MSTLAISTTDLPAVQGDAPLTNGRQFYGAIAGHIQDRGLTFGEVIHSAERKVPDHTHETSYYSLVISGGYDESFRRGRIYFQPFSSALTRAGTKHDGRIASCGVRVFTIEIGKEWIKQFVHLRPEPDTVQDLAGGELTCLGIRLYREYCTEPVACSLTIDALVWELLAAAGGMETHPIDLMPVWWPRALDLLHAEFTRDLRISEVAGEVGVHPVHLARVFRRLCRQTPGEYVQRLRVRFASEKLALPGEGIAQIAAEAGFADQNHLTRVFKKYTQMTPGAFRRAFAAPRLRLN
jgi:AraC family transcriptional regulator